MAYPFGKFPTLREFVRAATSQGCVEKFITGEIRGPRGSIQPRYLIRQHPAAPAAILPNIPDDEPLTAITLGQLVRTLKIHGYEHLLIDGC